MPTAADPTAALLSPAQLAEYLGLPVNTLYRWRSAGDGPRGLKLGKHVRYRPSDVEAWLEDATDPRRPVASAT